MKKIPSSIWLTLLILICALAGFWLAGRASRVGGGVVQAPESPPPPRKSETRAPRPRRVKVEEPKFEDGLTTVQAYASCRSNELILRFPSEESFGSFEEAVENTQGKVRMVAQLPPLLAMRLGYDKEQDVQDLLAAEHVTFFKSVAPAPDRGAPVLSSQTGSEPVGNSLPKMVGATGDRSRWGEGVRIGIMDSGVIAHPTLKHFSCSVAVVDFPADLAKTNGHGTAVASLAAGSLPDAQGLAPAAEVISIKVATEEGRSDALFMATGILEAINQQVDLLNISMGQSSDSPLLHDAVQMAQDSGIVIVAAAGNDGVSDAGYPADYPGVVSVGAVDGKGVHMGFSNFGKQLSLCAPGCLVNAAWPIGKYVSLSGTSASAPIVTGAIAAVMSNGSTMRMSAADAARAVIACADDAGIPGNDTEYGAGLLNVGRVMRRDRPNVIDAAVTELRVIKTPTGDGWEVEASVQNQGTTIISNPMVEVQTPGGVLRLSKPSISPGGYQVFTLPVYPTNWPGKSYEISAVAQFANAERDITPGNNLRKAVFTPP